MLSMQVSLVVHVGGSSRVTVFYMEDIFLLSKNYYRINLNYYRINLYT
jgi:hypothetical protein